jgi:hypothetical protein
MRRSSLSRRRHANGSKSISTWSSRKALLYGGMAENSEILRFQVGSCRPIAPSTTQDHDDGG